MEEKCNELQKEIEQLLDKIEFPYDCEYETDEKIDKMVLELLGGLK